MVNCVGADVPGRIALDCDVENGGFSFFVISKPPNVLQIPKICASAKCMEIIANLQKTQPTECVVSFGYTLYGEILNPILSQCAAHPEYGPGMSKTLIAFIVIGCLVAVAIAYCCFRRHRERLCVKREDDIADRESDLSELSAYDYTRRSPKTFYTNASPTITTTASTTATLHTATKANVYAGPRPVNPASIPLLQDPVIQEARIDHDAIEIKTVIASGAYGSVATGVYLNSDVAIKRSLETTVTGINKFMEEIKLMASFSHSCIVTFYGVAWTKPEDVCVVMEYMAGGDLCTVLKAFNADATRQTGFDAVKFRIALDVAEALAYLHSRPSVVIHRDLKSQNILLTKEHTAKVTDFGVSRETVNDKMTMKVGTQLWMAPEVIKGHDYDQKADVFSFGVVLSELDTNKIPYATHNLKDMTPLAVMQSVAKGQLVVEFSYSSDPRIVALGRECVSLDPAKRPTMEEARRRIADIWGGGKVGKPTTQAQSTRHHTSGYKSDVGTKSAAVPATLKSETPPRHSSQSNSSIRSPSTMKTEPGVRSSPSLSSVDLPLLRDAKILAVRIPLHDLSIRYQIRSGSFSDVIMGSYKYESVAIKRMNPQYRDDAVVVNQFLAEIKITASLHHENIVRFIGVAWQSPSDICMVSEFMEGGDLQSLLQRFEAERRAKGVDSIKLKIALDVAQALSYLHSLQPARLHGGLQSSNILLSRDVDAKLTDFGGSAMQAARWTAPEIIVGREYDEKADIFSFGVVLSELDSNKLPYAEHTNVSESGLMRSIATGRLTVSFSYSSYPGIVALGRDCVALRPQDRPSAAEVFHRLQQVLHQV